MGRNKLSLASCVILLVLVGLTAGLSSCGGGGGSRPVTKPGDEVIITPPENQAPIIVQTLEDITPPATSGVFRWESEALTEYFSDPDGDTLQFSAQTDNADVSSVEVSDTDVLIVHLSEPATARISVTATDPRGASATQHFSVTMTGSEDTDEPPPADHSDTQAGADRIAPGQTVRGEFHSAADVDWLRLDLPEPALVDIQLDAPTGAEITVFDLDGNVLASGRTQSTLDLPAVPVLGGFLIKMWIKAAISDADWTLILAPAQYIVPRIPAITIRAGLDATIAKDNIECGVSWADNRSLLVEVEGCEVVVTDAEMDLAPVLPPHNKGERYIDNVLAATVTLKNGTILVDTLCPAPPGEIFVGTNIRGVIFKLKAGNLSSARSNILYSVPIFINIDHADEKTCRPKAKNVEEPDGPELSTSPSVSPGDSVSINLTEYIRDPRKGMVSEGELSFVEIKKSEGLEAGINGADLKITAASDAEVGEKTITIRAKSTKYDHPLQNDFTLRVSVGCWAYAGFGANFIIFPGELDVGSVHRGFRTDHVGSFGYTVEYIGDCSDGRANGEGKLTAIGPLNESFSYDGEWINGMPQGNGALHISDPDWGVLRYDGGMRGFQFYNRGTVTVQFNNGFSWSFAGSWGSSGTLHGSYPNRGTLIQTLEDGVVTREAGEFRNVPQSGEFLLWNGTLTITSSSGSSCSRVVNGELVAPC